MSREVKVAQFMVGVLLCMQHGNCSGITLEEQTKLFFVAPNYCLADYCPELERIHGNSEDIDILEEKLQKYADQLDQLDQDVAAIVIQFPDNISIGGNGTGPSNILNDLEVLKDRLDALQSQIDGLSFGKNVTTAPQINLLSRIEANEAAIDQLLGQLNTLEQKVQSNERNLSTLTDELSQINEDLRPALAELEAKLRKLHIPHFVGLFSTEREVTVEAGKCQLLEITVDVLYETYPYFGGTTYVIVTVNGEPVYNGSDECDVPMNPAAVTDYTFGAPSRTFYIDQPDVLSGEVVVSYDICLSHISEIQPHLTVKCFQAY